MILQLLRIITLALVVSLPDALFTHPRRVALRSGLRVISASLADTVDDESKYFPLSRRGAIGHVLGTTSVAAAACGGLPLSALADALGTDQYKSGIRGADPKGDVYALPELPYASDALEPHISKEAIEYERSTVQANAVKKLNEFYNGKGKNIAIAKLQAQSKGLPAELKNAAGAHYNYCLFFAGMAPEDDSSAPSPVLRKLFDQQFGGEDGVEEALTTAALTVSAAGTEGWVWLGVGPRGKLTVSATRSMENPLMDDSSIPFLCLDVSPRAFSAPYGEGDAALSKYVAAWFNNLVNWRRVSANYIQFAANNAPVPCTQGDLLGLPPPSFV